MPIRIGDGTQLQDVSSVRIGDGSALQDVTQFFLPRSGDTNPFMDNGDSDVLKPTGVPYPSLSSITLLANFEGDDNSGTGNNWQGTTINGGTYTGTIGNNMPRITTPFPGFSGNGSNQNMGSVDGNTLGYTSGVTGWTIELVGTCDEVNDISGIAYDGTTGEDDWRFALGNATNTSGSAITDNHGNSIPNNTEYWYWQTGACRLRDFCDATTLYAPYTRGETFHFVGSVDLTNQNMKLCVNGNIVEQTTGWTQASWPATSNLQGNLRLFYRATGNRHFYDGNVYTLNFYNNYASDADLTALWGHYSDKYSIT